MFSRPYSSSFPFPPQPKGWPDDPAVHPTTCSAPCSLTAKQGPAYPPKVVFFVHPKLHFFCYVQGLEDVAACVPDTLLLRFQKVVHAAWTKGIVAEIVVSPALVRVVDSTPASESGYYLRSMNSMRYPSGSRTKKIRLPLPIACGLLSKSTPPASSSLSASASRSSTANATWL